ncbi:MAG: hypothetical protein OER91_12060, partial [Gammaproteobacteria bacterium]|nr:hypothetical protein [Gammaproteobacteria bacterium]
MADHSDTKTIDEFLAENPNVDVTPYWERCWGILSGVKERIAARFPNLEREENTRDRDYYTSPNGEWEGSMKAWSGEGMEWLVNSWLGNRKASILDMNATAFLGQETDVPHLVIVFGTIPNLFFYADYTPRRDLMADVDYLDRYYGDEVNQWYLGLRGHENFQWAVSHGNYMRALTNPVTQSLMGDLDNDNIDILEKYVDEKVTRWIDWIDAATPVPEADRAALQQRDHTVREMGYARDPMNKLAVQVFGEGQVDAMVEMRMGREQMLHARR